MLTTPGITFNRWLVVAGALLIQASLGAIYIYSVFKPALKSHFPAWSATDLALPSQIVLAFFALSMIVSGRIQDKAGPKITATWGAVFLGVGMLIAAKATTLGQFVFGFGVLGGIGIGAAYVCPIATCIKWFPDKRGFITGLAVAGFGAGGLIFTPLANYFISANGIMDTFAYLGLIFFFAIIVGSRVMTNPPAGYCPAGWTPKVTNANTSSVREFTPKEMLKTRQFWILWATYFSGCTAGLLVIMNITNIWQSISAAGFPNLWAMIPGEVISGIMTAGVTAVIAVSIFNSLGRIIWGKASDSIGREKTLAVIFALCALAMFSLNSFSTYPLFMAAVATVGFCFGGFLALYPALTADSFGVKNVGANYGLMFTAYGAGGLFGPWLAPKLIKDVHTWTYQAIDKSGAILSKSLEIGSYSDSFLIAGILCLISFFLLFWLKKLRKDKKQRKRQKKNGLIRSLIFILF